MPEVEWFCPECARKIRPATAEARAVLDAQHLARTAPFPDPDSDWSPSTLSTRECSDAGLTAEAEARCKEVLARTAPLPNPDLALTAEAEAKCKHVSSEFLSIDSEDAMGWTYIDNHSRKQGPFSNKQMRAWFQGAYRNSMGPTLYVQRTSEGVAAMKRIGLPPMPCEGPLDVVFCGQTPFAERTLQSPGAAPSPAAPVVTDGIGAAPATTERDAARARTAPTTTEHDAARARTAAAGAALVYGSNSLLTEVYCHVPLVDQRLLPRIKEGEGGRPSSPTERQSAPASVKGATSTSSQSCSPEAQGEQSVKASTKPAAWSQRSRADAGSDAAATRQRKHEIFRQKQSLARVATEKRKHENIMQELSPAKLRALEALGEPLPSPSAAAAPPTDDGADTLDSGASSEGEKKLDELPGGDELGDKDLGKGGAKRRRKVLRDSIEGITKPAIRRLARRGGVKRISGLIYEETRGVLVLREQKSAESKRATAKPTRKRTPTSSFTPGQGGGLATSKRTKRDY